MENLIRLRQLMNQKSIDGLAIVPGPNLSYLTGSEFHLSERPVILFVRQKDAIFVLPELESPKIADLDIGFISYDDRDGPGPAFAQFSKNHKFSELGVESRLIRHLELNLISSYNISSDIIDATDLFAELRMSKSKLEIDYMTKAVETAERSLVSVLDKMRPGVTEKQFAAELVIQLLQNGSDTRLPFSPIVASGVNAANPHHFPTDKEFREGELVIVDWGATHEGYFSDITRTYAIGNQIDEKLLRAYEAVRLANQAGRSKAVVGVSAGEVDSATRKVIEDLGFGEFFTHRTGHGLGLEIHEEPYIKPDNDFVLQKGMTFTIEPGIYIPGLGGIRIEDDVCLKTSGLVSLTSLPRELIIV
jgi:Xaa-Pro dipeptidase